MKREYPDGPIVAVGAAVCHEGRVLVVQRGREPSRGIWTLPGGAVDLGESIREAAAREVREECGIEIEVGEVVGTLDNIVRDADGAVRFHYVIIDLAAQYVSGELQFNDELTGAAWITPAQFDAYQLSSAARGVFHAALSAAAQTQDHR